MSENASSVSQILSEVLRKPVIAVNQQGSPRHCHRQTRDPSETTRRDPTDGKVIRAYMNGALHDGTYSSNHRFRISQKCVAWLQIMKVLLAHIGYSSWIYQEGKTRNVYVLETLAEFLNFELNPLELGSKIEQQAYLRGFFDAEGGIPHDIHARFYIQLTQKNQQKVQMLKNMLADMGIMCGKLHNPSKRVDPDYWRVFVRAESLMSFVEHIGSWHPEKRRRFNQRNVI